MSAPEGPFYVREGSPGGERSMGDYGDALEALARRDYLRSQPHGRRVYAVIGRDTDPPETGEVEWCEGCERVAVLASAELCDACDAP